MIGQSRRELGERMRGGRAERARVKPRLALRLLYREHARPGGGRMKLRRIEVAQFRKLAGPVVLDGSATG